MNAIWNETLGAAGAVIDNAEAELAAARDGTVVCPLDHLGLICVTGDDAKDFLHNQFTSDINHLGTDAVQHSAWCSAKGRMVASFLVWREGDDYMLALAEDLVEAIAKRLQMYVLRAKVKVSVPTDRILLGLAGPQAGAALAAANLPTPDSMKSATCPGGSLIGLGDNRFILAVQSEVAASAWNPLKGIARPVARSAWQWLDIRAGLPLVTAATREHFVPQMANFERIGGVSFHKGCYPGQEIVARTQYLGKVKRHLYRLRADVSMTPGTELFSSALQDQPCGMIVTGAPSPAGGFEALAVLMESVVDVGVQLGERSGTSVVASAVTND